jgi:hypothetical protein
MIKLVYRHSGVDMESNSTMAVSMKRINDVGSLGVAGTGKKKNQM